jgi:hypothetical protein
MKKTRPLRTLGPGREVRFNASMETQLLIHEAKQRHGGSIDNVVNLALRHLLQTDRRPPSWPACKTP